MTGLTIDEIKLRTSAVTANPGDDMAGFFAYDVLIESQQGTARGLMGLATSVIESMLRDLLVSDPMPPRPEIAALIAPGGTLDGRQALLNHLTQNSFFDAATGNAVQALFSCDRGRFGYGKLPRFDQDTNGALMPFLTFSSPDDIDTAPRSLSPDTIRDDFYSAFNSLTSVLLDHIGNRQRGEE